MRTTQIRDRRGSRTQKSLRWLQFVLIATATTLAGGCATSTSVPDGGAVPPGSGVLVLQISSNVDGMLSYVDYSPTTTYGDRVAENFTGPKSTIQFKAGESNWVLTVPQGDYMWSKFFFSNLLSNIQSTNHFVVKGGSITYIGHLFIAADVRSRRYNIGVRDDGAMMRLYLRGYYPKYSAALNFETQLAAFMHVSCASPGFMATCSNPEAPK